MNASGDARPAWATWAGLLPPEDFVLGDHALVGTSVASPAVPAGPAALGSWHARVVSSLGHVPGYVLPRVAQCEAGVVTGRHDPWAGLYKRPIGVPAIRTLTSPYNMGFTVARNMSLACLGLVHRHIVLLTEAEEKAIESNASEPEHVPFPWEELPAVLKRGGVNSLMEMTVVSTRGALDWLAGDVLLPNRCSVETVVRMHTDMRRTSRALAPAYPMLQRFTRVVKTAFWSEITLYVSEWLVTSVLETARLVMEGKDRFVGRLLLRTAVNGARCASLWLAVSVGNGVGASSPKMRPLTMLVGANAAALVVNMYWRRASVRIEARVFGNDGDDGDDEDDGDDGQRGGDGKQGGAAGGAGDGLVEDPPSRLRVERTFVYEFTEAELPADGGSAVEASFEEMTERVLEDTVGGVEGDSDTAEEGAMGGMETTGSPSSESRQQRPPSGIPSLPVRKRKSPSSGPA